MPGLKEMSQEEFVELYGEDCIEPALKLYHYRRQESQRYNRKVRPRLREEVLERLGRRCAQCGFSDARALQVDHVDGGGLREYRDIGLWGIYKKILSGAAGYQLLCANCNWIKRSKDGEVGGEDA